MAEAAHPSSPRPRADTPELLAMLDVLLSTGSPRTCNAATRRNFLRIGSLGLAGLALPNLRAETSATPSATRAKSVILVFLGGGLSHLDSFDLKPDAPADIRGQYAPIPTAVPGVAICEQLPLLAKVMDRVALVRSALHNCDHHETATNWVLSGRYGTPFGDYPAVGAVVAHEIGHRSSVPPYVAVPRNPSFTWELGKSAFLGGRYDSFKAGDPNQVNYSVQERTRAQELILSGDARRAFAIEREPERLRDRYGRTTAGQSMLLARRLIEGGVRFVTVNYPGWDHHTRIFESLDRKLPEFDRALSALVEDLDGRGLFAETLLVVMGEFGRTPRLNKHAGRDHWGRAGSLLFAGTGVKRGFVLGQTDRDGAYVTDRPVSPADVACTILDSLGIDPRKHLTAPDGRPIAILDQGEPIRELFHS